MSPLLSLAARRVFTAATLLALACSAPTGVRAALPSSAVLLSEVLRVLDDLKAIAPGSTPSDEQRQTLADDLAALAGGLVKPSAASLEQLADDLAAAAATGRLTHKIEKLLARDLADVLGRTTLDPAALRALADEVRTVLAAYGIDPADLQQLAADLETILDDFLTDSVSTGRTVDLRAENLPALLLVNYAGRAKLSVVRAEGRPAQTVLSISTAGLPPANPYTVAVIRRSDGGTTVLGKMKIHAGNGEIVRRRAEAGDQSASAPQAELASHGEVVFGGPEGRPLPDGFDPADVDLITLTDANGTERLAGSVLADGGDLLVGTRLANWRVDAGATDPGASGAVSFRVKTTGAKTKEAFLLYIGGLPASAPVTLLADGIAAGQFTTTAGGHLVIAGGAVPVPTSAVGRMLPINALPVAVDLSTVSTLTVVDAVGSVLASAGY